MKNIRIVILSALVCFFISGCANDQEEHPSIGSGTDDFKESPCACNEIEQRFRQQYVSG